ncbi:DNA-protecting protein DprA, partial [Candidatus Microgenomates bacterium]|nr:DNA-protecting protein DprA [Candidatus Microgenomates bacterium]
MDLFIKGEIPKDYIGIAIVGSRNSTSKGKQIAHKFAYDLAKSGLVIVSGLARGIDTVAHKAAIEAGGKTLFP